MPLPASSWAFCCSALRCSLLRLHVERSRSGSFLTGHVFACVFSFSERWRWSASHGIRDGATVTVLASGAQIITVILAVAGAAVCASASCGSRTAGSATVPSALPRIAVGNPRTVGSLLRPAKRPCTCCRAESDQAAVRAGNRSPWSGAAAGCQVPTSQSWVPDRVHCCEPAAIRAEAGTVEPSSGSSWTCRPVSASQMRTLLDRPSVSGCTSPPSGRPG